tara:strand:- start:98 stop:1171 length:1074 start_codon:yes stop_codon:yes gene_type:complete
MSDLLKEAIADAKAVRETALQNAKMALEEAFTPQLQSMLSAKLAEEDDELEPEMEMDPHVDPEMEPEIDAVPDEEPEMPVEPEVEGAYMEDDEIPGEEVPMEPEPEMDLDPEPEMEDELDLEAIVRELEAEINEEELEEMEDTSGGSTYPDNVEGDEDPDHVGGSVDGTKKMSEAEHDEEENDDEEEPVEETYEVELDEEEELKEEDDAYPENVEGEKNSDHIENMKEEMTRISSELDEYKQAVAFLKDKIHEVNILNAKLLFTNKLFKEFALDNSQKLRVVETFDRAQTTREIKLVYSTLAENFGDSGKPVRKSKMNESASAKTGSTKPSKESKKVITEEAQVANRFRKLAGLKAN